jgi:hypothetical protein
VVVAKFYRPDRWNDAVLKNMFAAELMAAEVPVVSALVLDRRTLNHFNGFQL